MRKTNCYTHRHDSASKRMVYNGSMTEYKWRVFIEPDYFGTGERLVVTAPGAPGYNVNLKSFDENGLPIFQSVSEGVAAEPLHVSFPPGLLRAIADKIKPGNDEGEVRELRAALQVERDRVDKYMKLLTDFAIS